MANTDPKGDGLDGTLLPDGAMSPHDLDDHAIEELILSLVRTLNQRAHAAATQQERARRLARLQRLIATL